MEAPSTTSLISPTFLLNPSLSSIHLSSLALPTSSTDVNELRTLLEKGSEVEKLDAMKAVLATLSTTTTTTNLSPKSYFFGQLGPLLMTIIRFVLPNQKNKFLKKLVLLFFEIVPKLNDDGKLLPEMILVCNALRSDLLHPNEWIRGITLRFLTRLGPYPELLESLIGSVRAGLNDPHPYVKRMAIVAIHHIYTTPVLQHLISDAPELLEDLLNSSNDPSIQRHSFLALSIEDDLIAKKFFFHNGQGLLLLKENLPSSPSKPSTAKANLQTSLLNWAVSASDLSTTEKDIIFHSLVDKISTSSSMVSFQEIDSFFSLLKGISFHHPCNPPLREAIPLLFKEAIDYILTKGDLSLKTFILNLLSSLPTPMLRLLPSTTILPLLGGILSSSSSSSSSSSNTSLKISLLSLLIGEENWLDYRSSIDLLSLLGDELLLLGSNSSYLLMILKVMHLIEGRFGHSGTTTTTTTTTCSDLIMNNILNFITANVNVSPPEEMFNLIEGMLLTNPCLIKFINLRILKWNCHPSVMKKMIYFLSLHPNLDHLTMLSDVMAPFETKNSLNKNFNPNRKSAINAINADGSYVRVEDQRGSDFGDKGGDGEDDDVIRSLHPLTSAIYYSNRWDVAIAIGVLLSMKIGGAGKGGEEEKQRLLLLSYMIDFASISPSCDEDSFERLFVFRNIIVSSLSPCPNNILRMNRNPILSSVMNKVDDPIDYGNALDDGSSLSKRNENVNMEMILEPSSKRTIFSSSLSGGRIQQMSGGLCDEVYCETLIEISGPLVLLDILMVNRGNRLLLSLNLDLFSSNSSLKCLERPSCIDALEVGEWREMKAIFMVEGKIESFLIFGSCTYEISGSGHVDFSRQNCIVMNPISLDICEWILSSPPMICSSFFREWWPKLEWENKVLIPSIKVYISHNGGGGNDLRAMKRDALRKVFLSLVEPLKFISLTANDGISNGGDYLAANLFSKSIFDELILANVCIETVDGNSNDQSFIVVNGHLRLRSKEQGIAIALGDRLGEIVSSLKENN